MQNAEAQLIEIQRALKYCDLDYDDILEDYRDHLETVKAKRKKERKRKLFTKNIKKQS